MHFARLKNSPRLQRVLSVLADGQEHSTREIVEKAQVCAVNSIIGELRDNGFPIPRARQQKRVWFYRLGKVLWTRAPA